MYSRQRQFSGIALHDPLVRGAGTRDSLGLRKRVMRIASQLGDKVDVEPILGRLASEELLDRQFAPAVSWPCCAAKFDLNSNRAQCRRHCLHASTRSARPAHSVNASHPATLSSLASSSFLSVCSQPPFLATVMKVLFHICFSVARISSSRGVKRSADRHEHGTTIRPQRGAGWWFKTMNPAFLEGLHVDREPRACRCRSSDSCRSLG